MPIKKCVGCGLHYMMRSGNGSRCEPCQARHRKASRETPEARKKATARILTDLALREGKLAVADCEVCGSKKSEAHHVDYDDPMNIRWLCRKHHMELHHRLRWRETMASKFGYSAAEIAAREMKNWGKVA